jgi:hypothetical protein
VEAVDLLVQEGGGDDFRHAAAETGVIQTVVVDLPMHRRGLPTTPVWG